MQALTVCRSEKVTGEGLSRTSMLEHVTEKAIALLASTIQAEFGGSTS